MANKLKKTDHCLNCNYHFQNDKESGYCPRCGQKNIDNRKSLSFLFKDALANFFALDSKVLQTIFYLFTQPGVLTRFFNNGKRVRFITPIRLFIVLSALSFLTLSLLPENYSTLFNEDEAKTSEEEKKEAANDISEKVDDLINSIDDQDTTKVDDQYITKYNDKKGRINLPDFLTNIEDNSVKTSAIDAAVKEGRLYEFADSLQIPTYPKQRLFVQFCKFRSHVKSVEGRNSISNAFFKYLPLGILFMMPFVALFLKILFWRKGYYVEHLIHSLHLHSFFFLVNALNDLAIIISKIGLGVGLLIVIYLLYTWQSLKVVYKLSYVRAFFNLIVLFVFDLLLFLFTFFISILFTFLLI